MLIRRKRKNIRVARVGSNSAEGGRQRRKRKYPTRNTGLALCHLSGDCHD
jgi:hypothetical protein